MDLGGHNGQDSKLRHVQQHAHQEPAIRHRLPSGMVYTIHHPHSRHVHVSQDTAYVVPPEFAFANKHLHEVWDRQSIMDFAPLICGVLDDMLSDLDDRPELDDSDYCTAPNGSRLSMIMPELLEMLADLLVMTGDKTKGGAPNGPSQTSAIHRGLEERVHRVRDALGLRGAIAPLLETLTGQGQAVLAFAEGTKLATCKWTKMSPTPAPTPIVIPVSLSNDDVQSIKEDKDATQQKTPKFAWNPGHDLYDEDKRATFNGIFHLAYNTVQNPPATRDFKHQLTVFKQWVKNQLEREQAVDGDLSKAYADFLFYDTL